jgi:adenine-specific DNA-methyltransferase
MPFKPNDVNSWADLLGLFPVPLTENAAHRFVLLNGVRGNFCLDLVEEHDDDPRAIAWSADVGHYLTFRNDRISLIAWNGATTTPFAIEDLVGLHGVLEANEPPRDAAVIPHFVGVFRRLRALLMGEPGFETLQAFLTLLACAATSEPRGQINAQRWGLSPAALQIAAKVDDERWQLLIGLLTNPRSSDGLRALPSLVIRHAAGLLFQEAHYQVEWVERERQLSLFTTLPRPATPTVKDPASLGVHFTPPSLARALTEEALKNRPAGDLVVFDPACGSGEFLREALRQLRLAGHEGRVTLIGWDISEAGVAMARFALAFEKGFEAVPRVTVDISRRDSMLEQWPTADIILMNPPFVSWDDLSDGQRQAVRATLGDLVKGKADLASAFLKRATDHLSINGVIGSVLPASLLDGSASEPLRAKLTDDGLKVTLIARLGSHSLFPGARVDAAMLVATRHPCVEPLAVWASFRPDSSAAALRELRKNRNADVPQTVDEGDFSVYAMPPLGSSRWSPRPFSASRLALALDRCPRAGQLFDIRQGVLTGLDRAFVLTESEFGSLPRSERRFFRPAVVNESIAQGRLRAAAYVFYPYSSGGLSISSERSLKESVGTYYREMLLPRKGRLQGRASLPNDKWWELTRARASWQHSKRTRLLSTYFGKPGSFAVDLGGAFVAVQGYSWEPRNRPSTADVLFGYAAILNAPMMDDLLGSVADHVGGGQWNLSKRFVSLLPLPDLWQLNDRQLFDSLRDAGKGIAEGLREADSSLDPLAKAAFGLP